MSAGAIETCDRPIMSLDPDECPHLRTSRVTSNSGDGSRYYDHTMIVCDDCDTEVGEPDDD